MNFNLTSDLAYLSGLIVVTPPVCLVRCVFHNRFRQAVKTIARIHIEISDLKASLFHHRQKYMNELSIHKI
jgi:hypothetical protein